MVDLCALQPSYRECTKSASGREATAALPVQRSSLWGIHFVWPQSQQCVLTLVISLRIVPQLFDSLWGSRLDGMDTPPIKAREQRLELGVVQRRQAIFDARPSERVLFQPFVGHDNPGTSQ